MYVNRRVSIDDSIAFTYVYTYIFTCIYICISVKYVYMSFLNYSGSLLGVIRSKATSRSSGEQAILLNATNNTYLDLRMRQTKYCT